MNFGSACSGLFWIFEYWSLRFVWDLEFVIWDLNKFILEKEELLKQLYFVNYTLDTKTVYAACTWK